MRHEIIFIIGHRPYTSIDFKKDNNYFGMNVLTPNARASCCCWSCRIVEVTRSKAKQRGMGKPRQKPAHQGMENEKEEPIRKHTSNSLEFEGLNRLCMSCVADGDSALLR